MRHHLPHERGWIKRLEQYHIGHQEVLIGQVREAGAGLKLGVLVLVVVHRAAIPDRDGACRVFPRVLARVPGVHQIGADGGDAGASSIWSKAGWAGWSRS